MPITKKHRIEWTKRRDALHLTTRDVARLSGRLITHGTVTNIERGMQHSIALHKFLGYMRALQISKEDAESIAAESIAKESAVGRDLDIEMKGAEIEDLEDVIALLRTRRLRRQKESD